jgi:uncharacterized protein (DUF952 family)
LDSEGFIHLSGDRQLLPSAERHFHGQRDLVVLALRADKLSSELRYDEAHGQKFPHLYGPLNLDAVVEVVGLPADGEGCFLVPAEWRPWASYFGRPGEYDPTS